MKNVDQSKEQLGPKDKINMAKAVGGDVYFEKFYQLEGETIHKSHYENRVD